MASSSTQPIAGRFPPNADEVLKKEAEEYIKRHHTPARSLLYTQPTVREQLLHHHYCLICKPLTQEEKDSMMAPKVEEVDLLGILTPQSTQPSQTLPSQLTVLTPSEKGFLLEDVIHNALSSIHGINCRREKDIKTYFNDQSLNGVDHWIQYGNLHFLIQDKWKESTTQQEVSQFITCAERLKTRLSSSESIELIWASKVAPTANSLNILKEKKAMILSHTISIEGLASLVVIEVCCHIGIDPIPALKAIKFNKHSPILTSSTSSIHPTPMVEEKWTYDYTDEGKLKRREMESFIQNMYNSAFRKCLISLSNFGRQEIYSIYNSIIPKDINHWQSGEFKKVDFNGFLKAIKSVCVPTRTKKLSYYSMNFYTKMRFISTELCTQVSEYNYIRSQMIANKSAWAKNLPTLTCNSEPMTDAEYKGVIVHCDDYWPGLENNFYQTYYN